LSSVFTMWVLLLLCLGVLKDYLRELPEPLLTKCLYQMLVDALGVCLPDDPEGNARLLFSIIECLPKPNRVSFRNNNNGAFLQ
jgi:hypothetical protein